MAFKQSVCQSSKVVSNITSEMKICQEDSEISILFMCSPCGLKSQTATFLCAFSGYSIPAQQNSY